MVAPFACVRPFFRRLRLGQHVTPATLMPLRSNVVSLFSQRCDDPGNRRDGNPDGFGERWRGKVARANQPKYGFKALVYLKGLLVTHQPVSS
jgi:hypothetical protein